MIKGIALHDVHPHITLDPLPILRLSQPSACGIRHLALLQVTPISGCLSPYAPHLAGPDVHALEPDSLVMTRPAAWGPRKWGDWGGRQLRGSDLGACVLWDPHWERPVAPPQTLQRSVSAHGPLLVHV